MHRARGTKKEGTMKRGLLAVLLTGAMAVSLAACGGSSSGSAAPAASTAASTVASTAASTAEAAAPAEGGNYKIDVICKTLSSEYWTYIEAGAKAYEKEHPGVTVDVKGPPSETSYDEQQNMIQTDLASGAYDGVIIAPLQSDLVANMIKDTELPIMALDTNVESDKVVSFIGTGNKEAAKAGAMAAVEEAKKAGWTDIKCIEIAGVQGDATIWQLRLPVQQRKIRLTPTPFSSASTARSPRRSPSWTATFP